LKFCNLAKQTWHLLAIEKHFENCTSLIKRKSSRKMLTKQRILLDALIQFDLQMKPPVPEQAIRMLKTPAATKKSRWNDKDDSSDS